MCVYVCVGVCVHLHMCTCECVCTCTGVCWYVCVGMCVLVRVLVYEYWCVLAYMYVCVYEHKEVMCPITRSKVTQLLLFPRWEDYYISELCTSQPAYQIPLLCVQQVSSAGQWTIVKVLH